MTATASPPGARTARSLRDPAHRMPVIGLVTVITVVAVEAMSVATVMPTVVRDLHGLRLYSWGFTAYLLADVVGMVDAGRRCDRHGPSPSLLGGLGFFAAGLLVASTAPDIGVFLAGRVLQGLGGGAMIVAAYVVVARAFPEELHPKVFAALSAAWVVPSLVGPAVAGFVASTVGWRWVFGGIAPLAIAGAALLVPVLRRIPVARQGETPGRSGIARGLMLSAALGLLQVAAEIVDWWSLLLIAAGLALGIAPLRAILPRGAFRLARGLPTVIVLRGILTCGFFGAEAYLPLTLTRLHHGTPRVVGIPLTLGAIGWSIGSWWQGRRRRHQVSVMRVGFGAVAVGVALLVAVAAPRASLWLAVPIWAIAGAGMGIAMPTISVLMLDLSPNEAQGMNSAALQISDMTGSIIGIAAVGALVTAFGLAHIRTAVTIGDLMSAGIAVVGAIAAGRAIAAQVRPGSPVPAAVDAPHR
ncbi:MAG TPA: MFS transporter [Mycobacteriales bacterium]|nr:MFS transporter [Mycobacteriales bacterium]